jgi:glycosyltransferase involved in cell wall biosynthesis
MFGASVVICTHNPRPHYLSRVLDSLRIQTLDKIHWELLLVDNQSKERLADSWDLSWHPNARHVQEPELGQASARQRGMRESQSDLVVFVDDDNVLASDYLATGLALGQAWPQLGLWGSATILPEYEVQPQEHLAPLLHLLALRNYDKARWTNIFQMDICPWGAGMFLRRRVADVYREHFLEARVQVAGRRGASPVAGHGGEDVDLSYTAVSLGMGVGVFPELRLTHLIPKERVTEEYLLGLHQGIRISDYLLLYKWKNIKPITKSKFRLTLSLVKNFIISRGFNRKVFLANIRARQKADRIVRGVLMTHAKNKGP